MNSFFEYFFQDSEFKGEETQVLCPYPHVTESGLDYFESNPSAGVNLEKGVFHCLRCGASKSEATFMQDQLGCTYEEAIKIRRIFNTTKDNFVTWKNKILLSDGARERANNMGISNAVLDELGVKSPDQEELAFPVSLYGKLLDIRRYNPNQTPKVKSNYGALSGLILPYDIWSRTKKTRWTIVCAGEKDMAVARSLGFNAITVTGGEGTLPILTHEFKDRKVAIIYDNDDAGIQGARKIAAVLKPIASVVKIIDQFHTTCVERGEDLTDFFVKYGGSAKDIQQMIVEKPEFTEEEAAEEMEKLYPTISLFQASGPDRIGKTVRSNIQVVSTFETSFSMPTSIEAKKMKLEDGDDKAAMFYGETRNWDLGEATYKDMLHLIDNNFKETDIAKNIRSLLRIPNKEKNVKISKPSKITVFKCSVTDLFESTSKNTVAMEYVAYSIGHKLESGKKYKATYQIVPHPYVGQQLIMLITDIDTAADSVSSFQLSEENINNLKVFQQIEGSVADKVKTISDKVKGIIGFDANDTLIQTIDLSYHTVLEFNFGKKFQNVRGYLDTLVVSESRVGKSSTAEALRDMYNLGVFASLAGSSATKAGLIGGSNKVQGSHQTRAGLIPQNHRNLVIFEELAKCSTDILKELTDVRSSNEVRIVRVNGALYLPALVRMITLTNVKSAGNMPRSITSYPNGIEVIIELVGTAEDIARYDLMLVLATPGSRSMDFNWEPEKPFEQAEYQTRIQWVWSREPEQVILDDEVLQHIVDKCNELNAKYDSHIKIFGTEAWKKVSRLAIAVAGYTVSTDETYQNIVVTKECVDFAVEFFEKLYDNDTFKLKEYVDRERSFTEIDAKGIEDLEKIYAMHAALLNQLEQTSYSGRNELMASTGLTGDEFNKQINVLVKGMYVRWYGQQLVATERFRKGMAKIDRNSTKHPVVGSVDI